MTKQSFHGKSTRATEPLELIHSNVCGSMNTPERWAYLYFVTFTNDYSRYEYIYLMQQKFEIFEKFEECRADAEN